MAWHSTERPSCLLAQTSPLLSITNRCELNCAAALANTALEFSLTLGVKSGLFSHAYGQTVSNQFVFARCHSNPTRRCGLTTT